MSGLPRGASYGSSPTSEVGADLGYAVREANVSPSFMMGVASYDHSSMGCPAARNRPLDPCGAGPDDGGGRARHRQPAAARPETHRAPDSGAAVDRHAREPALEEWRRRESARGEDRRGGGGRGVPDGDAGSRARPDRPARDGNPRHRSPVSGAGPEAQANVLPGPSSLQQPGVHDPEVEAAAGVGVSGAAREQADRRPRSDEADRRAAFTFGRARLVARSRLSGPGP